MFVAKTKAGFHASSRRTRIAVAGVAAVALLGGGVGIAQAADRPLGALAVSKSADRSDPETLSGAKVAGNIYVFTTRSYVAQAEFFVDAQSLSGSPLVVERYAPFDLGTTASDGSARPFDTKTLSDGLHRLNVRVTTTSGYKRVVSSTFTVANNTTPSSTTSTTRPTTSSTSTTTPTSTSTTSTTAAPTTTTTTKVPPPATTTTTTAKPTTTTTTAPNRSGKNCAALPSACGYPDATNAGAKGTLKKVPAELTSGPGWHWDSRGWLSVDTQGAVLENVEVDSVDVVASNVTVRNVLVHSPNGMFGVGVRHANNVTIADSTIRGGSTGANRLMVAVKDIYGDSQNLQVLRNNIYWVSTGVQIDQGLIQDNYIHDMGYADGDHINGTTSNGGTTSLTIRHNTIFNQISQTDAISLFQDFGNQANRVIDNNLVAGGGYTIYGGDGTKGDSHDIKITNNRFSKMYFANGGYWGPLAAFDSSGANNSFTGNYWDETLTPVNG